MDNKSEYNQPFDPNQLFEEDENRFLKKLKSGPMLPLGLFHSFIIINLNGLMIFFSQTATLGFFGIAGYRVYKARQRGGMKLSFFLIHTRLAAQGFAVAALGSMVLWSLGKRLYNNITGTENNEHQQQ